MMKKSINSKKTRILKAKGVFITIIIIITHGIKITMFKYTNEKTTSYENDTKQFLTHSLQY